MKRIIFLITLQLCILTRVFGEEIEIKYNDGTDQPYSIIYKTLENAPGTVEVSGTKFSNGGLFEDAYYTVDVVEIPETIKVGTQEYTVTTINTEYGWGSDYAGPKKIVFPSTIRWIKSRIHSEKLEEVVFNDSPIEEMWYEGFEYCYNLKSVSFGSAFKATSIGLFSECMNLTEIKIPESVQEIPLACFSRCTSLKKVVIPHSIAKIEGSAFLDCNSLENIKITGDKACECTFVDFLAFKNCESLKEISFPSLSTIGYTAFANCINLSSVTINTNKDAEIRMGEHAFDNCVNLKDLNYEPTSLREIGEGAFNNCSSLKSFTIPSDCENIGAKAFAGCTGLEGFNVVGDDGAYSDIDGVLIKYEYVNSWSPEQEYKLESYPAGKKDEKYSIPESVSSVANGAFEGAVYLSEISIHDNVTDLGVMAFRDCKALKNVKMPETLNHIPSGTFSGCTSLEKVSIPDSYIYIGTSSFQDCSSLPEVKLPSELKVIGESAFTNCSKIENIELPAQVKQIRANTFRNCESLKSITLPADLDTIQFAAFQGCKALKSIKLPETLKSLDDRAFKGCESIVVLTIPDNVSEVGINAFEDCTSLREVKVGNGVKEIGQWAFFNCTDMEKLTLGSSLESIGAQAFDGDINIKEITCLSPEPPSFPGGFPEEVMENATVIVPEGSEDAYNTSPEWDPMVEGEVQKAESILINYTEIELQPKESVTLTAEVLPADAVHKEVTWTSDDYYVAKVDENGIVTAKDYGTAVITATCGDVIAECVVRVIDPDGVDSILSGSENSVDIYDANGILLRKGVSKEVLDDMTPGLYIVRKGDKLNKLIIR